MRHSGGQRWTGGSGWLPPEGSCSYWDGVGRRRRARLPGLQPSAANLPAVTNRRLLETLESQFSPLSAGPPSAGDVMTMVALATAGRRRAAGDFFTLKEPGPQSQGSVLNVQRRLEKELGFLGRGLTPPTPNDVGS